MEIEKRYRNLWEILLSEHKQVFDAQPVQDLERLMKAVAEAGRIFVAGAGREGIAARSFSMRLMHLGKETHWVWDDTAPGMGPEDLLIAVDGSGCIGHMDYLIRRAMDAGARTAVLTGAPEEAVPESADVCVFIPACVYKGRDERVILSVQPMGSLFEQHLFLLFDILILLLQEELGVTNQEMEGRHRNIE